MTIFYDEYRMTHMAILIILEETDDKELPNVRTN